MSRYESTLANNVLDVFRTQISSPIFEVLPVNQPDIYKVVGQHLHIDSRVNLTPFDERREVQRGIDVGDILGRCQLTAVFEGGLPVGVFTFIVDAPINISRLEYVREVDGSSRRYSFTDIYGTPPNYLIIPAYTEILPAHRSSLRESGFEAVSRTLNLLMSNFNGYMVELVAQGNDRDIGVTRRDSSSVIKWAGLLGMERKEGVGAIPSLGPVFYRY